MKAKEQINKEFIEAFGEEFQYMIKHGNKNDGTNDYYSLIIEIDFQKIQL